MKRMTSDKISFVATKQQQNENEKYLKKYLTKKRISDKIQKLSQDDVDP